MKVLIAEEKTPVKHSTKIENNKILLHYTYIWVVHIYNRDNIYVQRESNEIYVYICNWINILNEGFEDWSPSFHHKSRN